MRQRWTGASPTSSKICGPTGGAGAGALPGQTDAALWDSASSSDECPPLLIDHEWPARANALPESRLFRSAFSYVDDRGEASFSLSTRSRTSSGAEPSSSGGCSNSHTHSSQRLKKNRAQLHSRYTKAMGYLNSEERSGTSDSARRSNSSRKDSASRSTSNTRQRLDNDMANSSSSGKQEGDQERSTSSATDHSGSAGEKRENSPGPSLSVEQMEALKKQVPIDESGEYTSVGSVQHHEGLCRACLFVSTRVGCHKGIQCTFCHFPHKAKSDNSRSSKGQRHRYHTLVKKVHEAMQDEDPAAACPDAGPRPPGVEKGLHGR